MKKYRCFSFVVFAAVLACSAALAENIPSGGAVTPLGLCSLAVVDGPGGAHLRFGADALVPARDGTDTYIGEAINRSLEYFFTGLSIPDDKLWVNLKPGGKDLIVDPLLGSTDLGKIMLAADLTLKKDASEMTNPRTSRIGRQYWDRLYAKAAELGIDDMPIATRVWVTPGNVALAQDPSGVRIIRAGLKVCLESERARAPAAETATDEKQRALQEYASALMRDLIVPALDRKVNEGPAYEQLRQAYRAVILARWYRQRTGDSGRELMRPMGRPVSAGLSGSVPYTCDQIYREYMASLQQGDYNFSDDTSGRLQAYMELITHRYFSGGVDWRVITTAQDGRVSDGRNIAVGRSAQFSFDVVIDAGQDDPAQYAMEHVSVATRGSGAGTGNDQQALTTENLPPLSAAEIDRQLTQKQDPAVYRIIIRNL